MAVEVERISFCRAELPNRLSDHKWTVLNTCTYRQDYLYSVGYVIVCYVYMYAKRNNNYRIGHAFKRGLLGEETE